MGSEDVGKEDFLSGHYCPILNSHLKLVPLGSSSSKSSKWSTFLGGGILSRLRSSLNFPTNQKAADKQDVLPQHIIPKQPYHPPQQQIPPHPKQQLQRVSQQQQLHIPQNLPYPQPTKPFEQKKPLLQNIFGQSTLLKYLGLGKKQKLEMFNKPDIPVEEHVYLRNKKPLLREQSEEQDEKSSNEDREEKDDEDTNDDEEDPDEDRNDKSEDEETAVESLNDKSQERENEKSQENDTSKENRESSEKDADNGKSTEEGDLNKSDELDENIRKIPVHQLKVDIDEELAEIEVPNQQNRLRTGNQPPKGLKSDLLPNKKQKKKKKFQDKVYSFLFKTMDVIDKHFMNDEEDVLEA